MSENLISVTDLMKMSVDGMIDVDTIAAQIQKMVEKQNILSKHPYKIWLATDGYWKTKVKESDGKLRLIKKKNKSDLEDAIIKHAEQLSQKQTFKDRFDIWVKRQKDCGRSNNTIVKYEADYKRFFAGYPFEQLDITKIDEETLSKHILQVLADKQLRWRAFKDIMGYTTGVFEKARRDRVINENPMEYIDIPIYKKYCYIAPVKTTKERTLSVQDIQLLLSKLRNPPAHNTNRICCFAIEMALYTGMRVGELTALTWDDFNFEEGIILIRHSERYDRKTKTSIISATKNGKERIYPILDEIKDLLSRIESFEKARGWYGEYVFQDANGRLSKQKISDSTRNLTMSDEFTSIKSIHAIRRTLNSQLRNDGMSAMMASSLLGHTERVNNTNYTYDMSCLKEKREAIEKIVTKVTKMQNEKM